MPFEKNTFPSEEFSWRPGTVYGRGAKNPILWPSAIGTCFLGEPIVVSFKSDGRSICRWIDGKPLPVGGSSKDKQSAFGFGASCIAKGYKLYAVGDNNQGFVRWMIKPMNHSESNVAAELVEQLDNGGYLIGDGAYDLNRLYKLASKKSIQLITPQRIKKAKGLGHRRHHLSRVRAMSMNKRPFGQGLIESRKGIERMFGNLTTFCGGLKPLPHWVRTLFRVRLWVRGKMILYHLWRLNHVAKTA